MSDRGGQKKKKRKWGGLKERIMKNNGWTKPVDPGTICFNCGQEGHLSTQCPFPKKKRKKAGKAQRNTGVFVEGLPKNVAYDEVEEALRTLFHGLGKIAKIKVYRTDMNHYESSGSALVVFAGVQAAKAAMGPTFQGKEVKPGHPVKITEANFGHKTVVGGVQMTLPTVALDTSAAAAAQLAASITAGSNAGGSTTVASLQPIPTARSRRKAPPPTIAAKSVSGAVLMYDVFDPMQETSREEKEFQTKCEAFPGLTCFTVTMNGSAIAEFETKEGATKCANSLHGTKFGKTLIVCDFVASKDDPKPVLSKEVLLGNTFSPAQAVDEKFVSQLENDFRVECSKYGPVTEVETLVDKGLLRIVYKSGLCAADCVNAMNGRPFDGQRMTARTGEA